MKRPALLWLGLALLLLPSLRAQSRYLLRTRIVEVDPTEFPRLAIKAEILDVEGRALRTLERRHLAVYEDDELLKILELGLDKDPISIVLALDSSGTMRPAEDQVRETAGNLLRLAHPKDAMSVLEFSDQPRWLSRFGESRKTALSSLQGIVPYGPTALYDGLYRSLLELAARKGRRNVVVISDGKDQNKSDTGPGSRHTETEVIEFARKLGASIHVIALGPMAMKKELAKLAAKTEGSAFYAPRPDHLRSLLRKVVTRLEGRIQLVAESKKPKLDGSFRRIDLRVQAGESFGEDRAGYMAPGRLLLELGPVGFRDPKFGDVAQRAVRLRDSELLELSPGERQALFEYLEARFRLPEEARAIEVAP